MRAIAMLTAAFAACGVHAQEPSDGHSQSKSIFHNWDGRLTVAARPTFGTDLPEDIQRDLVDESEAEVSFRFTKRLHGNFNIQLRGGATFAPNYFDEDDARSALYAQISIGERENPLTAFRSLGTEELSRSQDTILPYVRYRYIRGYEQFFERLKANDHRFTVGLTYQDIRGIMCSDAEWRRLQENPDIEGLCTGDKGLYWQVEGNFNRIESTDPLKERSYAALSVKGITRPFRGFRLFAELGAEAHFFSTERIDTGRHREDQLARVTVGLDLTTPLARLLGVRGSTAIEATIGGRWERNWSNRADKRYERAFVVPVLSFWINF